MIFSVVAVASVLSLLPVSRALALNARETECTFVCPDTSTYGNGLSTFAIGDTTISCSYSADYDDSCIYDIITGALTGDNDVCPEHAAQQCFTRRSRQLKQAVMRRGVYDGNSNEHEPSPSPYVGWKREGSPSSHPKRTAPSPTWGKSSDSWYNSKPTPSPSPSPWNSGPKPPNQKPCDYRCPQKDLAKNPLTDGAIRDSSLYCSYSTPACKTCSFCKYSTKTGILLEDNDEGKCPQTAILTRPWDRRYI